MKLILSGTGVPILPLQGNVHNSFCSSAIAAQLGAKSCLSQPLGELQGCIPYMLP